MRAGLLIFINHAQPFTTFNRPPTNCYHVKPFTTYIRPLTNRPTDQVVRYRMKEAEVSQAAEEGGYYFATADLYLALDIAEPADVLLVLVQAD